MTMELIGTSEQASMMECKRIHPDSEPYLNYNLDNNLWGLTAFTSSKSFHISRLSWACLYLPLWFYDHSEFLTNHLKACLVIKVLRYLYLILQSACVWTLDWNLLCKSNLNFIQSHIISNKDFHNNCLKRFFCK